MVASHLAAALVALCLIPATRAGVSVRDDRDREVRLEQPARRIVSLSPHLTEDLFAIGAGERIVGTVDFSDYPPAARQVPRVGGHDGLDLERIRALGPDLILAWSGGNPSRQLAQIEALGIAVFHDGTHRLGQLPAVLERLGVLTGRTAAANAVAESYRRRLAVLESRFARKRPVRVFFQVWEQPLMTVSREQVISDALRVCGAVNVFASLPALVPAVDEEAVLAANPELIVTTAGSGSHALARWLRWSRIEAVKNRQLVVLPRDLLDRPGPRLVEGTEALCRAVDGARKQ